MNLKDIIAKLIVDNTDSNSSTNPLSARCGKSLQMEIDELKKRVSKLEKGG